MPLRDHFRPPVWKLASWEGFHGMWPASMVRMLDPLLPAGFSAEPRAHLGSYFEIDVCAYEDDEPRRDFSGSGEEPGGVATAVLAPATVLATAEPTLLVDSDLTDQYEYEVLVYDHERGRRLVAAVEIVSPANKDRPENRRAFVTKCAALLQQGVSVSIVDLVTTRHFNLYTELLTSLNRSDPAFAPPPPSTYAVTCRCFKLRPNSKLAIWAHPLVIGQSLPALPIWLTDELRVSLDLEASYEDACRVLRIP